MRRIRFIVTYDIEEDDTRTCEEIRQECIDDLGGLFGPTVDYGDDETADQRPRPVDVAAEIAAARQRITDGD